MESGARSIFGAPMFEPELFRKQIYCIEEIYWRTFCPPPAVIRCPHSDLSPGKLCPPCPFNLLRPCVRCQNVTGSGNRIGWSAWPKSKTNCCEILYCIVNNWPFHFHSFDHVVNHRMVGQLRLTFKLFLLFPQLSDLVAQVLVQAKHVRQTVFVRHCQVIRFLQLHLCWGKQSLLKMAKIFCSGKAQSDTKQSFSCWRKMNINSWLYVRTNHHHSNANCFEYAADHQSMASRS